MKFNLWYGQSRASQMVRDRPVRMEHRHVAPVSRIQLENKAEGVEASEYRVNEIGNIDVTEPDHIHDLGALGYPEYVGKSDGIVDGLVPDDLKWFMEPLDTEQFRALSTAEHEMHTRAVAQYYIATAKSMSLRSMLRSKTVGRMWDDVMCTLAGNTPDLETERRSLFAIPTTGDEGYTVEATGEVSNDG